MLCVHRGIHETPNTNKLRTQVGSQFQFKGNNIYWVKGGMILRGYKLDFIAKYTGFMVKNEQ